MKEHEDKIWDEVSAKILQKAGEKTPPVDFTQLVMDKIEAENIIQSVTTYKPLISKNVWGVIAIAVMMTIAYIFYIDIDIAILDNISFNPESLFPKWEVPSLTTNKVIPKPMIYGVVILALLVAIEIPLLKRKFLK